MKDDLLLAEALQHPNNNALALLHWLAHELNVNLKPTRLKRTGTVCDIRPGFQEEHPSLSYSDSSSGAVFKRHGADDFGGGAIDYITACLMIPKSDAAKILLDRADLTHRLPEARGSARKKSRTTAKPAPSQQIIVTLPPLTPEAMEESLKGWQPFDAEAHVEAAQHLAKRGLVEAAQEGFLSVVVHSSQAKLAFAVPGTDGKLINYKARNLQDPLPKGAQRYHYLITGGGAPAWCAPNLSKADREIWLEGELNGAAVSWALRDTGIAVQGIAGASSHPHTSHLEHSNRIIYIYADPDVAGDKARAVWEELAVSYSQTVVQLPHNLFGRSEAADACDVLGAAGSDVLRGLLIAAIDAQPASAVHMRGDLGYAVEGGTFQILRRDARKDTLQREVITDFAAFIDEELLLSDGASSPATSYRLSGVTERRKRLPPITVSAQEFRSLGFLSKSWGLDATVYGKRGAREHAEVCIQLFSKLRSVRRKIVLTHTGWHQHDAEGWVYLSNDQVIGKDGVVTDVSVQLPSSLQRVRLPTPPEAEAEVEAVRHTLALLDIAPPEVARVALATLMRSVLGPLNATVVFHGATGRHKTTFLALLMAHFGAEFQLNRPLTGWDSTANHLVQMLHHAKDMLALVDDYKPNASRGMQAQRIAGTFVHVLQAMADGGGKGTLTADRVERAIVYPRGTLITSAEDIPEGHSNQARSLLVPVRVDLLGERKERSRIYRDAAKYAKQGGYAASMAGYVRYLAGHYPDVRLDSARHQEHLARYADIFQGAHDRNGEAAAELSYGWQMFLRYVVERGILSREEAEVEWQETCKALMDVVAGQGEYHTEQDPVTRSIHDLITLLAQGTVYLRDSKTGEAPPQPQVAGWEVTTSGSEVSTSHRPSARSIGWVDTKGEVSWAYLLPRAVYAELEHFNRAQNTSLPSSTSLWTAFRERFQGEHLMHCDVDSRKGGRVMRTTKNVYVPYLTKNYRCVVLAFPFDVLLGGKSGNTVPESPDLSTSPRDFFFPPLFLTDGGDGNTGKEDPGVRATAGGDQQSVDHHLIPAGTEPELTTIPNVASNESTHTDMAEQGNGKMQVLGGI